MAVAARPSFVLDRHLPAVEALGSFAASIRYKDLPPAVQIAVKTRLLDALTSVFAAHATPPAQKALALAEGAGADGPASYWLSTATGSVQDCVFVNAILVHSALLDDCAPAHLGSVVTATALAVAEAEGGRTGAEILAAIAAGYEIGNRIDSGSLGPGISERGVRYSNVIVAFGAAATAANLMKLPADQIADALALTASLCPWGTYEPLGKPRSNDGFVQIGAGARSGVYAAELARAGFTGNRSALEGASGLYFVGTGRADPPAGLLEGLGSLWHLEQVISKPYPCGSPNTYPIYCADRLVHDHAITHDDIEAIEIRTPDISRQRMVAIRNPGPFETFEEAIISCYFTVAATFVFGGFDIEVAMRALGDPRVEALAQRSQFVTVQAPYPKGSAYAVVTVTLRDGRALTASSSTMPKALQRPDWNEMTARFRALTQNVLSDDRREQVIAEVWELDERPDGRALIAGLRSLST